MTLRERENQIFDKYRARGEQIIRDGALGEEFEAARPRVLVILKEPNDPDGSWAVVHGDIRNFGRQYNRPATWNNLGRWSALANDARLTLDEIDVTIKDNLQKHLRRIAVVNLKKSGGGSLAVRKKIREYAAEHWSLLQEQFKLYKPDLTITGGVFDIVRDLFRARECRDNGKCFAYFKHPDLGVCFDFYHPQPRLTNSYLFDCLKKQLDYHRLI